MAKLTEELLVRYYDGELGPSKAKWVEQQLEASPEHAETLRKMTQMGALLNLMAEESLAQVSFTEFNARVEAGIKATHRPGLLDRLKVWASEFFEHRRIFWVPTAALATAAVAVLVAIPFVRESSMPVSPAPRATEFRVTSHEPRVIESTIVSVKIGQTDGWKYDLPDGRGGVVGVAWIVE